jgi:UrcA family protein
VAGLAAIGLAATAPGQVARAQPYDYSTASGGQVTVYAPRVERDPATGADIDVVHESRAVYYGDLDLNSRHGVRVLSDRIERAASDACQDLDNAPGLTVIGSESDSDCIGRAVYRAMAQAPIAEDVAYRGYDNGYRYRYSY